MADDVNPDKDLGVRMFKNAKGGYSVVRETLVVDPGFGGREIVSRLIKAGTASECVAFMEAQANG